MEETENLKVTNYQLDPYHPLPILLDFFEGIEPDVTLVRGVCGKWRGENRSEVHLEVVRVHIVF